MRQTGRTPGEKTLAPPPGVVTLVHRYLAARTDDLEQILRDREQVLALRRIVVERRTGREQRALELQEIDVECLDRPGRRAVAHEHAERAQAVERGRERGLADAVIDDIAEFVAADLFNPRDKILLIVEDDVVAAIGEREIGLRLGAHGTDHMRAERLCPLAGQ